MEMEGRSKDDLVKLESNAKQTLTQSDSLSRFPLMGYTFMHISNKSQSIYYVPGIVPGAWMYQKKKKASSEKILTGRADNKW